MQNEYRGGKRGFKSTLRKTFQTVAAQPIHITELWSVWTANS